MAGPCPPLGRLCGWALSSSCRAPELCQLCGWLGLVLLLSSSWPPLNSVNSVAGLCGWALSSSWWALWLGSVSRPVVLLLAAPLNSVNLCGWLRAGLRACSTERKTEKDKLKEKEREREKKERKKERKKESKRSCAMDGLVGSWPPLVLCAGLCGWALSSSCPPLVLVLAAPLNSVAGLCGPAYWRGVWPNNKRCQCRQKFIEEAIYSWGESRAYQETDF